MPVKNPRKAGQIEAFQRHEKDNGSTEVQVALLTDSIKHLTEHLKRFPQDHATRRGLLRKVGRRTALLRYYAHKNPNGYKELIQRLGIRR